MKTPNLLKVAIAAAGGTRVVSAELLVTPTTVSRWINGSTQFPAEKVAWLCEEGGNIIERKRLACWLADRQDGKRREALVDKRSAFIEKASA